MNCEKNKLNSPSLSILLIIFIISFIFSFLHPENTIKNKKPYKDSDPFLSIDQSTAETEKYISNEKSLNFSNNILLLNTTNERKIISYKGHDLLNIYHHKINNHSPPYTIL